MEEIKVLRGDQALEVIEEMLDNDFVLTPDFRLIYLQKDHVLIKKAASCGPTESYPPHIINKIYGSIQDVIKRPTAPDPKPKTI